MKREVYESQKAFAGEKKPSMLRRCVGHDYTERQMYMVTMVTEGRQQLFGRVIGNCDAKEGSPDAPHIELTELGKHVEVCWHEIALRHPQIDVLALQMMPDHLHGILFVKAQLEKPLGKVLLGFKQGCNKAYRELFPNVQSNVQSVAVLQQQTGQRQTGQGDRYHGLLFATGYNDKLLLRQGQLQRWLNYLRDNPRRLLMKREHPDLFRMHRTTEACALQFTSMGNHFLLEWPDRQLVEMSRDATEKQIDDRLQAVLAEARNGVVTYTAAISKGESVIARTVREQGFPLVVLLNDGFPEEGSPQERYYKPGGVYFDACSKGKLLLMEPAESAFLNPAIRTATEEALRRKAETKHFTYTPIPVASQRYHFVASNEIGRLLVNRP